MIVIVCMYIITSPFILTAPYNTLLPLYCNYNDSSRLECASQIPFIIPGIGRAPKNVIP